MSRNIKAVIFDMNGVLIKDSGPVSKRLESKYGISADILWPVIKLALKDVRVPEANSTLAWKPLLDLLKVSYEDFFKFWFEGESLNKQLLDFVKAIKKEGVKIIILSNNFPERTNNYRNIFPELFDEVDEQYFSWETGNVKPDINAFTQIINKSHLLPSEYLYFDDNDDNIDIAKSLGINAIKFQNTEESIREIQSRL